MDTDDTVEVIAGVRGMESVEGWMDFVAATTSEVEVGGFGSQKTTS